MFRRALLLALFLATGLPARRQPPSSADALQQAVRDGNLAEVQRLVKGGENVNSLDYAGNAPLLDAAFSGHLEIARFLIASGADPSVRNAQSGVTALIYAVLSSRPAMVQLLLAAGAHVDDKSRDGESLLHLAATKNNLPVLLLLLDAHADMEMLDADGRTPLDSAILHNQTGSASLLIKRGADVIHVRTVDGRGPLHEACIKGLAALLEPLIAAGADAVQRDRSGQTPLDLALAYKNENVVAALLQPTDGSGESVGAVARDAMENATLRGQTEIARLLIEAGFDINQPTASHSSYLNDAALKGQAKVAQLLLDHGASLESHNAEGGSPLHDAALGGSTDVMSLLLDRGAQIDARDRESGATPLMLAASMGRVSGLTLLLKRGASPNLRDKQGRTALDRAKETGSAESIRLLVAAANSKIGASPRGL
jgi:ankyrin repeat protein